MFERHFALVFKYRGPPPHKRPCLSPAYNLAWPQDIKTEIIIKHTIIECFDLQFSYPAKFKLNVLSTRVLLI